MQSQIQLFALNEPPMPNLGVKLAVHGWQTAPCPRPRVGQRGCFSPRERVTQWTSTLTSIKNSPHIGPHARNDCNPSSFPMMMRVVSQGEPGTYKQLSYLRGEPGWGVCLFLFYFRARTRNDPQERERQVLRSFFVFGSLVLQSKTLDNKMRYMWLLVCFTCFQCLEQERETIPKNENGKYHILTIHDGVHRLLIHDAATSTLKNMIHCPTHASTNPMRNGSALPLAW